MANIFIKEKDLKIGLRVRTNLNGALQDPEFYIGIIAYIKPRLGEQEIGIKRDDKLFGGGDNGEWVIYIDEETKKCLYYLDPPEMEWDE
jgi:hypothetical protein